MIVNLILVVGIVGFIINTRNSSVTSQTPVLSLTAEEELTDPLDELSGADIAVNVAELVHMEQLDSVRNNADTVNAQLDIVPNDSQIVAKPQIINTALKSKKDIIIYKTEEGDTVKELAEKFGVTSDSIKWSNDISRDNIVAGLKLRIPPVNGIVYKVKSGETAESLATRFRSEESKIIAFNDAELTGLKTGELILIPDGRIQAPSYSSYSRSYAGTYNARFGGNGYTYGWCTWHAANRRLQNGQPMPNNLGNAISWYYLAQRAGMRVGSTPKAGAILWHANLGGLGHVAYVESMKEDGSMLVSDMNYPIWGVVTYRTVPPSEFGNYRFIY